MKKLTKELRKSMWRELDRASEKHGESFNSPAEAYAVIKEEVEEAQEHMQEVSTDLEEFWGSVKRNSSTIGDAVWIREYALSAAAELIQVAAMAQKAMRGYEVENREN